MLLLSFDIEEFDAPIEMGGDISFEEQIAISAKGTRKVLEILKEYDAKATFFCTVNFALHAPDVISAILKDGHEIASHGYYHSDFSIEDLAKSKIALEDMTKQPIYGFRMARMIPIDSTEIIRAGYLYDASLNPTFIPNRYNNLNKPRTVFRDSNDRLWQMPSSVTPLFRIPLFWLSMHHFPMNWYCAMCNITHRKDGYLQLYFHPWEFTDLHQKEWKLPYLMRKNSGEQFTKRLHRLLVFFSKKNIKTSTTFDFISKREVT